jgi:predicted  nucleic acid-binding Zn-ribbon protein
VNEQLRLLVETQRLDTQIIDRRRQIERIPLRISSMEKPLTEARLNLEGRKRRFEEAKKKRREKERDVETIAERIEKLKGRTAQIKTNQEYQALLKEIEAAEGEKFAAEDVILELMELVDRESIELQGAEARLGGEEAKAAELKRELEAEVREAEKGVESLMGRRAALVGGIEGNLYRQYMDLLETRDGLAVVEAWAEVCQGCNMNIMPQLFVEIKKNEEIFHCPQCRRFLYYPEKEGEKPAEAPAG